MDTRAQTPGVAGEKTRAGQGAGQDVGTSGNTCAIAYMELKARDLKYAGWYVLVTRRHIDLDCCFLETLQLRRFLVFFVLIWVFSSCLETIQILHCKVWVTNHLLKKAVDLGMGF
jgi:hypothetical protein